jgi:hypothetical protein
MSSRPVSRGVDVAILAVAVFAYFVTIKKF